MSDLESMTTRKWWRDAAIYQVYPRSFRDSNGDGIGDLQGVIAGLDYLSELGVDAIWLSPFYRTPNRDGGYDISDPRDVDPQFGTIDDAKALIEAAHRKGIRVIVDLVPNHFSSDHPWFQEALRSRPGSAARSLFHFYDGRGATGEEPPNNWCSIFGGPAWTRVSDAGGVDGQWYLHLFDSSQPDLNWNSGEVRDDFERTIRFWLDLGVDGFRVDVAHGLVKDQMSTDHHDPEGLIRALRMDVRDIAQEEREALLSDIPFFDRDGVHEIYRSWRAILDSFPGDRMMVAEAWVHPSTRAMRYVRGDELHQIFNFDYMIVDWDAESLLKAIEKTLGEVASVSAPASWVLSNHDSARVVTRLGGGRSGRERSRALALLTHCLPGSIYVFQGEELGLEDVELADQDRRDPVFFRSAGRDKGRDGARVPIPWVRDGVSFGFTSGRSWLPMPSGWDEFSIDSQIESPSSKPKSHLSLYQQSLKLRKGLVDKETRLSIVGEKVIAVHRGDDFLCFVNTSARTARLEVPFAASEVMLCSHPEVMLTGNLLLLPGDSAIWLSRKDVR